MTGLRVFMMGLGVAATVVGLLATQVRIAQVAMGLLFLVFLGTVALWEIRLRRRDPKGTLAQGLGLLGGLLLAQVVLELGERLLASYQLLPELLPLKPHLEALVVLLLGYVGAVVGRENAPHLLLFYQREQEEKRRFLFLLDAEALIDGRIVKLSASPVLFGELVVPRFVADLLQSLAASVDPVQRLRGQRGLENLRALQQSRQTMVFIREIEVAPGRELEGLVEYASQHGARLISPSPNLAAIARKHDVPVINLNEVLSALSPVVAAGDELVIKLVKPGKEREQAVGYLEDGNMVVVENGRSEIGKTVRVVVTGIHQTRAGTLVFSQLKK